VNLILTSLAFCYQFFSFFSLAFYFLGIFDGSAEQDQTSSSFGQVLSPRQTPAKSGTKYFFWIENEQNIADEECP
jgi:hypothetical protein